MKRGLVIGKFLPIHQGHVALINFAASQCDELIVSMSYTDADPIPKDLRFFWITETFKDRVKIKPELIKDDFDDEKLPLTERTKRWGDVIRKVYPPVHILFSSEEYGEPFAANLDVPHSSFDPQRGRFPVSASLIRQYPFQYWDFILPIVRPFFVRKVCLFGPESTGKSTLAIKLAQRYQTEFVPEVAREFIGSNDFTLDDIVRIGNAHFRRIEEKSRLAYKILFCDTDAITTQIYCRHYLKEVPEILYELERRVKYDIYFLFDIDVPWISDGLRDLGNQRESMMNVFRSELEQRGIPFVTVKGNYEQREEIICRKIDELLKQL